jgi:hypothetical protein
LNKEAPHYNLAAILRHKSKYDCLTCNTFLMTNQQYQQCLEACQACATACHQCAVACLNEKDVEMLKTCIQLDLECAVICNAAATVMSMEGRFSDQLCRVCADICNACADECEKHAQHGMEHCRRCADMCRKCATACEEMAAVGH